MHSATLETFASKAGGGKAKDKGIQQMIFHVVGEGVKDTVR